MRFSIIVFVLFAVVSLWLVWRLWNLVRFTREYVLSIEKLFQYCSRRLWPLILLDQSLFRRFTRASILGGVNIAFALTAWHAQSEVPELVWLGIPIVCLLEIWAVLEFGDFKYRKHVMDLHHSRKLL